MMTASLTMHIHAGESVTTIEVFEDMRCKLTTNVLSADIHQMLIDSELIFGQVFKQLIETADTTLPSTH